MKKQLKDYIMSQPIFSPNQMLLFADYCRMNGIERIDSQVLAQWYRDTYKTNFFQS